MFPMGSIVSAIAALHQARHGAQTPKPEPLCVDCTWAHIQWKSNAQRDLHCSFGNGLRPVRAEVLYCTDFRRRARPRNVPPMGFVQVIAPARGGEA
jgi:hypothetical protein